MAIELRFSARSHVGMVRKGNEDSGYGSSHLLVIADGMGGHAAGEVASATALRAVLEELPEAAESGDPEATDPESLLREAVARAGQRMRELIGSKPELEGMGTTLTALLQVGDRVAIAQVGDSRGYLLRHGVLEQVTHDQTFVQSLVDQGRISHDDARTHPQRSLLLQALDGRVEVEPVIAVRAPQVGDRYLLCSDGLSGVLAEATMREVLMVGTPAEAADQLIDLALRGGAPDNVTCVVADVIDADDADDADETAGEVQHAPAVVGAAVDEPVEGVAGGPPAKPRRFAGADDGDSRRLRGFRLLVPVLLLLVAVGVAGFFGYRWTQTQYFVGANSGRVAIFRGVPQHLVGHSLAKVVEPSNLALADLPEFQRGQVQATMSASSLADARKIVGRLQDAAATCVLLPQTAGCPQAAGATTPGASTSGSPTAAPTATSTGTATPSPSVSKP